MKSRWMGFLLLVGLVACSNDADDPHGATVLEQSDGSLQGLQLAVPEGAYTGSEPLTMTAGADIATEGLMDPSMTTESVGQAVAFGPSGTQFVQPVTIALPFSKAAYNGANLTGKMIDVLHQTADGAVAGFDVGPIGLSTIGFDVGPIGFDVGPIGLQANEGNEENDLLIIFQTTHFSTFQVVVVGQPVDVGCTPNCQPGPMACGDDGCGGSCGDCGPGQQCKDGQCTIVCAVDCAEKDCGDDGCGGTCGDCASDEQCSQAGVCECKPQCDGKNCGDDGCDGSCGDCGTGQQCEDGQCTALCAQDCAGKECGDDGCGGTCGDCKAGFECSENEPVCLPSTCDAAEIVFVDQQVCVGQTLIVCTNDASDNWTLAATYCPNLGLECITIDDVPPKVAECQAVCNAECAAKECGDDGCGGSCGTCAMGETCLPNGACCEGSCAGKDCGLDGCGVSCGTCANTEYCSDGSCLPLCTPDCLGKECGPDGCGGTCGTGPCLGDSVCASDGVCVPQSCMSAGFASSETAQKCFGDTLAECNVDSSGGGAVSYSTTYCPNAAMTCAVTAPMTPEKAECQCDDALCQALMGDPCIFAASCVGTGPDSFCEMESYEGCIGVGNGGFVVQDPTPGGSTKDMATTPDASMNFEAISVVVDSSIPAHIITLHLLAPWDSNPNATGLRVYEVLLQKLTQLAGTGASNEEAPLAGATNRTQWSNIAADQSWASYAMAWNGSGWDDEITPTIASCVPGKNDNTTIVCTVPHNTVACQDLFDPDQTNYKVYTQYTTSKGDVATKAWTSYGTSISGGFISL